MARVDVLVPTCNYAQFLPGCIASLVSQEGVEVRVLIIDDASTDDTPAVASRLHALHPTVAYRRLESHAGTVAICNEGLLQWVAAPYALVLSAADLLAPGALRRAVASLEADDEIGMVCGFAFRFESEGDIALAPLAQNGSRPGEPDTRVLPASELVLRFVAGNPIASPTAVVRMRLQRLVGGYDAALPRSAAMEMWMRFAVRGKVAMTRFVQAYERVLPREMGQETQGDDELRERLKTIETACRRDEVLYARYGLSRDYARRAIAEEAVWRAHALIERRARAMARRYLELACEIWPAAARTGAWRNATRDLRLDGAAWRRGGPLARGLRLASSRSHAGPDPRASPQPRTLQGWWPSRPADLDVPGLTPAPIPPGWILEGSPVSREKLLASSADGMASAYIWDCTAGRFDWFYDVDELAYVLEGTVILEDSAGERRVLGSGDSFLFPAGSRFCWSVPEYVRKIAFLHAPLSLDIRLVKRVHDAVTASFRS